SSSSAISKGVSVVPKLVMVCGCPSSMRRKLSGFKPDNGRPALSVTTAGTDTSCVSTLTTSPSSTSSDADAGGAFFVSVVCSEPLTRRGRCVGCCCVICCAATHTVTSSTREPGKRRESFVITCIATHWMGSRPRILPQKQTSHKDAQNTQIDRFKYSSVCAFC